MDKEAIDILRTTSGSASLDGGGAEPIAVHERSEVERGGSASLLVEGVLNPIN